MSNSWGQYALDDQDGLVFIGTSQPGPDWNATLRPGPNLLANSIVAVNMTDGAIVWADKSIARGTQRRGLQPEHNIRLGPG